MGFFDTLSAIGSAIGSAVSTVCGALGSVGAKLGSIIGPLVPHIGTIVGIIDAVVKIFGIFKQEYSLEDYGAAMREAEKKPKDFDNINAYIDYLNEEMKEGRINLNREKSALDKGIDQSLGAGLAIMVINEKYKLQTGAEFWLGMGKKFNEGKLDAQDVETIIIKSSQKGINAEDIGSYMQNKNLENGTKPSVISDMLEESLKNNPALSDQECKKKLRDLIKD
ncbi:hypothetical protein C3H43_01870 [Campylobacter jejuni]|uniref:hypothetical protein n=1 Tax=Campylobacter jejuni TaxID=197 RepID=UPI000F7FF76B|nr:hypothetical protein [Campylobacter jejuni]RTJ79959.1 hypothetical protein C3H52_02535 [Campylobacter jejuni]RTJ96167.1 hypothetical protein C3H43_01870 [Campylobacter jejuni]